MSRDIHPHPEQLLGRGPDAWRTARPPLLVPRPVLGLHQGALDRGEAPIVYWDPDAQVISTDAVGDSPLDDWLPANTYDATWGGRPLTLAAGRGARRIFLHGYAATHSPRALLDGTGWVMPLLPQTEHWRIQAMSELGRPQHVPATDVFVDELVDPDMATLYPAGTALEPGHPPVRHPRPLTEHTPGLGDELWLRQPTGWLRTRLARPAHPGDEQVTLVDDADWGWWSLNPHTPPTDVYPAQRSTVWAI